MAFPFDFQPDPAVRAQALERLMRQRQLGYLGQLSGDKVLSPIGQRLVGESAQGMEADAQGQQAMAARAMQAQQFQRQQASDAARLQMEQQKLGLERMKMAQDQFAAIADPVTGEVILYNKKTGQRIGGTATPRTGAAASGLKPQQFEQDVQKYGADMEEIAKAAPDVATLKGFASQPDQPGFGPIAGRVPDFMTSGEGVAARQAAGRLMANLLHMISGAAVSEPELQRQLQARGLGTTATPEQFRQGVKALEEEYANLAKQRRAKYVPQVPQTYEERGGFKPGGAPAPSAPGAAGAVRKFTRGPDGKLVEVK